jgi:hypothetical protein
MMLDFLQPDDPRWAAFLGEVRHDFYHLPAYLRVAAAHDGGRPEAVLIRDGGGYLFLPYLVRGLAELPGLHCERSRLSDVASPYGYPGPLAREGGPGFLDAAIRAWLEAMCRRGVVSAFIRLHPLFPAPLESLAALGTVVRRGRTVAVDLTLDEEECRRQTAHGHRQDIARACKRGWTVRLDQGAAALPELEDIYRETMARLGADDYYVFPTSYFRRLEKGLGGRLWVGTVRDTADAALAAALFVECCGILQYHLAGTRTAALPGAPSKLLLDGVRRWAKGRGLQTLHLGGGRGAEEDSLFRFKAGFSERRHDFVTWQLVFDQDVYRDLEARRQSAGVPAARAGFFPSYRA